MKKSLFTLLVMMLFGTAFAQTPTTYHYESYLTGDGNGTMFAQLYIDGELVTTYNWEIGVYDGALDRFTGHGLALSMPALSEYPVYSFTYSGNSGDLLTLHLYNHDTGEEVDYVCPFTMIFSTNMWYGSNSNLFHIEFYTQGQEMHFIGQGDWNDLENWQDVDRLPMALDDVIIDEGAVCHMPESAIGQYASLTIEDGGQLYAPEDAEVVATVKKNIEAYTAGEGNNWYLLSLPVDFETPDFSPFNTNSDYDLYYFDQNFPGDVVDETSENGEWRNYKYYMQNGLEFKAPSDNNGKCLNGYLYANNQSTTLYFTGNLYTSGSLVYQRINFNNDVDQVGVNLVGNPYTCNAEMTLGTRTNQDQVYMLNEDRDDVIVYDVSEYDYVYVAPMTSFFAIATANNNNAKVTLNPLNEEEHEDEMPGIVRSNESTMSIELTANGILKDRVYVKSGEGENCIKFSLNKNSSKIFVPQNNKNYAIAYTEGANVMPMCFTTKENGIYTLNFNTKNMNCSYLHLIDNVTGTDIDLFQTPSYTFNSSDSNYANRFKLVFSEEATNEIAENFAFISNGELMINNSGNATLQVMDITGRILSTENIQNCYSKSLNLSAGVYVVRLSNGNDVKAQKIVVE